MSQLNITEHNLPNGIPPQMDQFKPQNQFNGVHSSNSSRDPSPAPRLGSIPSSQLPPGRPNIPASQLPPSRSPITTVTHKMGQMNVATNHLTPNISPKFSTSTPNQQTPVQKPVTFGQSSAFSPITSNTVPIPLNRTQVLDNVPLNSSGSDESNTEKKNLVTSSVPNQFVQNHTVQPQNLGRFPLSQQLPNQFGQVPPSRAPPPQLMPQANTGILQNARPLGTAISQPGLNQLPSQTTPPNSTPNQFNQFSSNVPSSTQNVAYPNVPSQMLYNQYPSNTVTQPQPLTNQYPNNSHLSNLQNGPPKPPVSTNQAFQNSSVNNNQGIPQRPYMPPLQPQYPQQNFNAIPSRQNAQSPQMPPSNQPPRNNLHNNRYPISNQQQGLAQQPLANQQSYQNPQYPQQNSYPNKQAFAQQAAQPQYDVVQQGFNKFWGTENLDLLQQPNILPPTKVEAPKVHLGRETLDNANCSPDILRCTLTKIPENNSLLQKSRLPLGVLIHPFKDLNHLPVIQCNVIVRCRTCRTYINPFVYFVDNKRWKCNLCYRINELPEEFQYDPVSKSYGDPSRRPEIKASTIEYIAPAEYMLRPPQPAVYLFLLDVSRLAIESGYLHTVCNILLEEIKNLPGDARTQIGFIVYDSSLHFYSLAEGLSQPHEMTVLEIDDIFLPCPDNLLVNLKDRMELVIDLLGQLPTRYNNTYDNNSALGAALQAAYKMMGPTGGRITVFQASLPNVGPGALTSREDPSQRSTVEVAHLNPANDFYKRLALECSGQQIAVDLFIINSQYVDIATVSGISRFSGGCIHHFPLFKASRTLQSEALEKSFRRYLTRKIGFEAVMRIRCTRGLAIHTFHGNFFVRSTDLLSLPNINPDAGFGMQVAIEESLSDVQSVCFQAALLYTSSKGERRIRVHTLCLPVASTLQDIIHSADQQCIVGLLSKMAVDRSMQSSLSDAREAFINVAIDILSSYKFSLNMGNGQSGLLAPQCLKLLPLYISALLKHPAFRTGTTTRLDDRVKAMLDMKCKPLYMMIQQIYPDLYPIHNLEAEEVVINSEDESIPMPPRLQLTARCLDNAGAFLMDLGEHMIIYVSPNISRVFLNEALGVQDYSLITDQTYELPIKNNAHNQRLHNFINYLNDEKPFAATIQIIRDNSPNRMVFLERLIEDRVENALSYHEFLQHLKTQVK